MPTAIGSTASLLFSPFVGFFFFQAEDGIRDHCVTGVQTCALPIFGWMFGRIRRVMATTRSHASAVEDSAHALLWFDGGVTGMLDTSWSMPGAQMLDFGIDRKSTRLNSSHTVISYAVFCLKKKKV